jgi:hypothetical protein
MYIICYFGPYARWEITREQQRKISDATWDAIFNSDRFQQVLMWNMGGDGVLPGERNGEAVGLYCYVPHVERPGYPQRPMLFQWQLGSRNFSIPDEMATDWEALDRAGELAWFKTAYSSELEQVEKELGLAPRLCWGVVHWNTIGVS